MLCPGSYASEHVYPNMTEFIPFEGYGFNGEIRAQQDAGTIVLVCTLNIRTTKLRRSVDPDERFIMQLRCILRMHRQTWVFFVQKWDNDIFLRRGSFIPCLTLNGFYKVLYASVHAMNYMIGLNISEHLTLDMLLAEITDDIHHENMPI